MEYYYASMRTKIRKVNEERIRFWKESKSDLAAEQITILEKENADIDSWNDEFLEAVFNSRFA